MVMKMQSNVVKAFRQRLVRGGFTNIYIWNNYNGKYTLDCRSPEGKVIRKDLTEIEMSGIPRTVWFD